MSFGALLREINGARIFFPTKISKYQFEISTPLFLDQILGQPPPLEFHMMQTTPHIEL